eukprot:2679826-Amphidinium_carterae.1
MSWAMRANSAQEGLFPLLLLSLRGQSGAEQPVETPAFGIVARGPPPSPQPAAQPQSEQPQPATESAAEVLSCVESLAYANLR